MTKESIRVSALIPAPPEQVYDTWLDSGGHTRMTGGAASIDPHVGGHHRAWDGYIEGRNLELERGRRIVQSWRSSEFPPDSEDSRVEVLLEPHEGMTRVVIEHTIIPEGQGRNYESGWHEHYFRPMARYFSESSLGLAEDDEDAPPSSDDFADSTPPTLPATPRPEIPRAAAKPVKPAKKAASKKAKPAAKKKAAPPKAKKRAAKKKAAPAKKAKKPVTKRKSTTKKKSAKAVTRKAAPKRKSLRNGPGARKKAAPKAKKRAKKR
jgi:uncharacterized protein YndB with AHSA1/START domain